MEIPSDFGDTPVTPPDTYDDDINELGAQLFAATEEEQQDRLYAKRAKRTEIVDSLVNHGKIVKQSKANGITGGSSQNMIGNPTSSSQEANLGVYQAQPGYYDFSVAAQQAAQSSASYDLGSAFQSDAPIYDYARTEEGQAEALRAKLEAEVAQARHDQQIKGVESDFADLYNEIHGTHVDANPETIAYAQEQSRDPRDAQIGGYYDYVKAQQQMNPGYNPTPEQLQEHFRETGPAMQEALAVGGYIKQLRKAGAGNRAVYANMPKELQ